MNINKNKNKNVELNTCHVKLKKTRKTLSVEDLPRPLTYKLIEHREDSGGTVLR